MSKIHADASEQQKPVTKLPYEKPSLKAVDLHADEIMGNCQQVGDPDCGVPTGGPTGPS